MPEAPPIYVTGGVYTVDPADVRLHRAKRLNWPATDSDRPCWRHVDGGGQCECEEEREGTTEGGW